MSARRVCRTATTAMLGWSVCCAAWLGWPSPAAAGNAEAMLVALQTYDDQGAPPKLPRGRRRAPRPRKPAGAPAAGQQPTTPQPSPAPTPPAEAQQPPAEEPPAEPDAPAAEPSAAATGEFDEPPPEEIIPPEEKTYRFGFVDAEYTDVVEGFARQAGLGVLGEAPKDGRVNLTVLEPISFKEALSRIRMILFNSSPIDPYWLDRKGNNLVVERLTDLHRGLPEEFMFKSLDELWAANPPEDELVLVIYTPDRPLDQIRQARDFLPDYVRITPLAGQNAVTIFALVKDIKKYLRMIDWPPSGDPRVREKIPVNYLLPSTALEKLSKLMDLGAASAVAPATTRSMRTHVPSRTSRDPSPLDTMTTPEMTIFPDDELGLLYVWAMPRAIEEIKELLRFIDVDTGAGAAYEPVVIPVRNVPPDQLIETLRQIINYSPTPPEAPGARKPARRIRAGAQGGQTIAAEGVTMFVHPSQSAIVVIASEEEVARLRRYVAQFDVSTKVEGVRIEVLHRDPAEIVQTVGLMFATAGKPPSPRGERFQLSPDPANGVLWFSGPEEELEKIRGIVASLDVPNDDISLHIYRLDNQSASFVANMLRQYDGDRAAPTPTPTTPAAAARRRASPVSVSKFTADDDRSRLFVICTEAEWDIYVPIIEQLDRAVDDPEPPFVKLPVANGSPDYAIEQLTSLFAEDPATKMIRFLPTDGGILVVGADSDHLDDIKAFLVEMDRNLVIEERVFEIRHADPAEIKKALELLVGGTDTGPPRRRRAKPATTASSPTTSVTIVQMGSRLLVTATPDQMEDIARHIATMDVPDEEPVLRVYTFERGVNVEVIADELATVMANAPGRPVPTKGSVRGVPAEGSQFIPQPEVNRLVVIAPESQLRRIEEVMEVLRVSIDLEPDTVALIELEHADPEVLVNLLTPLLDIKVKTLIDEGELVDTAAEPKTPGRVTARRQTRRPSNTQRFHIDADTLNNRLIVAGPADVVEEARRLVAEFDRLPAEVNVTFRIVKVENAMAADVVKAVKEMMGASARMPARARRPKDAGEPSPMAPEVLSVVEAPGGAAVVLNGPAGDVETATNWIKILDQEAASGKEIRVFTIHNADIEDLADLILNVVDAPPKIAARSPIPRPRPRPPVQEDPLDEFSFELTKTWTGQDVYLRADFVAHTLMAAAPASKMVEIANIVEDIDKEDERVIVKPEMPKLVYELKQRDDAFDAVFDLEMVLDALWDPPDRLPQVDYTSVGNLLVVRYPDRERFGELEELIAKHVDKPKPGKKTIKQKGIQAPRGMSPTEVILWLRMNRPDLDLDVIDVTPVTEETYGVHQLQPLKTSSARPCYLPHSLTQTVEAMVAGAMALQDPDEQPPDEADAEVQPPDEQEPIAEPPPAPRPQRRRTTDEMFQEAAAALLGGETKPAKVKTPVSGESPRVRATIDNSTGQIIFEGASGVLEEIPDWIDEMKAEIEDLDLPPDIRIYRVKHIDVFTAADILEEMYNATRQQLQQQQRQAQLQLQQQRAAQVQAARQAQLLAQQQAQQAGKGQPPQQQQQQQQQQQPSIEFPPAAVRIYPNPRDRSLILRAESHQYPVILKLLATIDRPQPYNSEFRTYQLKKLNAADVEALLRDFLGLDESAGASRAAPQAPGVPGRRTRRSPRSENAGSQLPRPLMQETMAGELGIDPTDIRISSNEAMNTIVAMAPTRALDYIGELIERFESEDIPERITRYYQLQHADSEEVAEQLASHFETRDASAGRRGEPKGAAGRGGSLNTPSFLPYPRLNMLTVLATAEQHEEVAGILERLDVDAGQDVWMDVALHHVSAKVAAETLSNMFGAGPSAAKGRTGTGREPKFIAGGDGRTLLYQAPENLHETISQTIAKLEEGAKDVTALRVIELAFASPGDVATAIKDAYMSGRGARGGAETEMTVTGHDPSKRLFIRAPEQLFTEIDSLVRSLDREPTVGFEFRIFPLEYADAKQVHTQMTDLITDYLKKLDPADRKVMTAFSVDVDEKSNSLIVLGNSVVFSFLEENLPKVDNPANARSPLAFAMIALTNAEATEVSQSINQLWSEKTLPAGETPPNVQAIAAQNAVLIRGTERQIAEIRAEVIAPLEEQIPPDQITRSIALKHAYPDQVEAAISKLFGAARKPQDKVIAVADAATNSIIVSGSAKSMARVEELIAGLDVENPAQQEVHILTLNHTDPDALARTLTETFIRSKPPARGGQGAALTITALQGSKALLVRARPDEFNEIQSVVAELDQERAGLAEEVRVVSLLYSDVSEMMSAMQEYLRKPGGGGSGKDLAGDMRISALTQSNSMMISGATEQVDRLEETIRRLDEKGQQGSVPQIIPLEHVDAAEIAANLQEMFTQQSGRRGQSPPVIIANEASNILIVRAGPSDFAAIAATVEKLDVEEEKNPTFVLIQVQQGVNVEELAPMVEESVNDGVRSTGKGRSGETPSITVRPDRRTNSLLVSGSYSLFDEAEELIRKMEDMGPSGGRQMRVIQLGNVPADEIIRLIERLKGESAGSSRPDSRRSTPSGRPRQPRRGG